MLDFGAWTGKWADQRARERAAMLQCGDAGRALETAVEILTPESTARKGNWN